jgi:hypothetical protein
MSRTDEPPEVDGRRALDACVVVPVPLLERQLAALEQKARSERRTIGQTIRVAIALFLAGDCDRCGADGRWGDSPLGAGADDLDVFEVALLLPAVLLAELVVRAAERATTPGELIRHIACCSLPTKG